MKIIAKSLLIICCLGWVFIASANNLRSDAFDDEVALTTDSRIKTYVYNPNDVFLLLLHYGFQSQIEFAKSERIENITLGDAFAWKLTPLDNRLFIKPLEKNIRTNMTIITNRNVYQFDLVSKDLQEGNEHELVYVVRFFYPKTKAR